MKFIKNRWQKISDDLKGTSRYWQKSASSILFKKYLFNAISQYTKDNVIDIGAGSMPYRKFIEKFADDYKSLDFKNTEKKYNKENRLDYIGDVQKMPFKDNSYQTVFCTQVLEHVPEPQKAIYEISRILNQDGHAIITVPHLAYLHNEPNDFYRYTVHGLKHMTQKAGLEIVQIKTLGGLFCFLGYIFSTIWLCIFYKIPVIWELAFYINLIISKLFIILDKLLHTEKICPLNYLLIIKK